MTGVVDATLTDVITFSTDQLAVGTNTLAVEVHQSSLDGVSLPLENASFEADSPPFFGPTGWTSTGISFAGFTRVALVEDANDQGAATPYPDGSRALVLRSNDGQPLSIHQDLGSVEECTYDLSFSVADRFVAQWLNYKVELLAVDGGNTETVIFSEDSALNQTLRPVNGSTSHPHSLGLAGAEGDWLKVRLQGNAGADIRGQTLVTTTVRDFVKMAFACCGIEIEFLGEGTEEKGLVKACTNPEYQLEIGSEVVCVDPGYFRPTEVEQLIGDPTKARTKLGWEPEYDLNMLVEEMMASDLKLMQKDSYLNEGGYQIMNYFE